MSRLSSRILQLIPRLSPWQLSLLAVILTLIITSALSYLFHGHITEDYLITGTVTALLVSFSMLKIIYVYQNRLSDSENRFRNLIEHSSDALYIHDFEGRFIDVNQTACVNLGYSREELLKMSISGIAGGFDLHTAQKDWASLTPGKVISLERFHRRKDETLFPVDIRLSLTQIGDTPLVLASARDMTQYKETENALLESHKRFRILAEATFEGIAIHSMGIIRDLNKAFLDIMGYDDPSEWVGRNLLEIVVPKYRELAKEKMASDSQ